MKFKNWVWNGNKPLSNPELGMQISKGRSPLLNMYQAQQLKENEPELYERALLDDQALAFSGEKAGEMADMAVATESIRPLAMLGVGAIRVGASFPPWRIGGSITQAMEDGSYPSWNTVRSRYWMNRATLQTEEFGASNIGRMEIGLAPRARVLVRMRDTGNLELRDVVKELHHARANIGTPGFDDPVDLKELWPWEHEVLDPHRQLNYDFISF